MWWAWFLYIYFYRLTFHDFHSAVWYIFDLSFSWCDLFFLINSFFGAYAACLCKSKIIIITIFKFLSWGVKTPTHVLLYPNSSFWVSRALISLRASLGRQKFLISSSRRATARLSTRAKLSLSKKGSKGPRVSRAVPSICPSDREEPCGARHTERATSRITRISHWNDFTCVKSCWEDKGGLCSEALSPSVFL